jgi:hypothetical protein
MAGSADGVGGGSHGDYPCFEWYRADREHRLSNWLDFEGSVENFR